jgi:hypothetical protein
MSLNPILASDTTMAFAKVVAVLFWAGIGGAGLFGIVGLALLPFKRVPRVYGIVFGTVSTAGGCGGLLFSLLMLPEAFVWAAVLSTLAVGILDMVLWSRRASPALTNS